MTKTTMQTSDGRTVTIRVRPVGQAFGCCGEVVSRNGRVLATTDTMPYGFTQSAIDAAVELAERIAGAASIRRTMRPLTDDERDGGARFEHIVNQGIDY